MAEPWKRLWVVLSSGVKVFLVDGDHVRNEIEVEYTLGGHHYVYEWIPEDEVWIEVVPDVHDRLCNLFHELYERTVMKEYGFNYDVAHQMASSMELEYRHGKIKAGKQPKPNEDG